MKTISTFIPRLGSEYTVQVTSLGYFPCKWVSPSNTKPTDSLPQLRTSMQRLLRILQGIHSAYDIRINTLKQAIDELRREERVFFPATAGIEGNEWYRHLPIGDTPCPPLPLWDDIATAAKELTPEINALDAELQRLTEANAYGNPELSALLNVEPAVSGLQTDGEEKNGIKILHLMREKDSTISGGDGLTRETAIVLTEKSSQALRQEYLIFETLYDVKPQFQVLRKVDNRHYDVLFLRVPLYNKLIYEKLLWFDITAYWEHTYGKRSSRQ